MVDADVGLARRRRAAGRRTSRESPASISSSLYWTWTGGRPARSRPRMSASGGAGVDVGRLPRPAEGDERVVRRRRRAGRSASSANAADSRTRPAGHRPGAVREVEAEVGGHDAARRVAGDDDARRRDAEVEERAVGRERVLAAGRVRVLGREAVLDQVDRAADGLREPAGERLVGAGGTDDEGAAVEVEDDRPVRCAVQRDVARGEDDGRDAAERRPGAADARAAGG